PATSIQVAASPLPPESAAPRNASCIPSARGVSPFRRRSSASAGSVEGRRPALRAGVGLLLRNQRQQPGSQRGVSRDGELALIVRHVLVVDELFDRLGHAKSASAPMPTLRSGAANVASDS